MKLGYAEVSNFGDALNPHIFNHYLPGFFDEDADEILLGIGSILGFDQFKEARKKVVFSSGYAVGYADPPSIDDTYDVICVRGPLTAQALGLEASLAITDGASLLRFMSHAPVEKKHRYTYIPHKSTEKLYDWRRVCRETGINYVSPEAGVDHVLAEIRQSEVILAEAMHGAIVADTFRIPWVPVITNDRINEFKWRDWTASLGMTYRPQRIPRIYCHTHFESGLRHRFGAVIPEIGIRATARLLDLGQRIVRRDRRVYAAFDNLKRADRYLSADGIFDEKTSKLRERLYRLERRYARFGS